MHKLFAVFGIAAVTAITGGRSARAQAAPGNDAVSRASAERPRPGDRVYLHVWREPKLSDTVSVDERGDVLFPKIGAVNAASMTILALRDTVRHRFGEFFVDSPIEIVVLRRISVNGAVGKPNVYYVDVATSLRDVIARAGGISADGDDHKVRVVRNGQSTLVRDWQLDNSLNSDLRSGDQVIVGRKSWLQQNLFAAISTATVVLSLVLTVSRK
jgi:polysaccharide export outer membrane protein